MAIAVACVALTGRAGATDVEVSATAGPFPFSVAVVLRDLELGAGPDLRLSAGLSSRFLAAGLDGSFDAGPVGRVGVGVRFAYVIGTGVRVGASGRGTFGPFALGLVGGIWTAPSSAEDPLSPFDRRPEPASPTGYVADVQGSFRLARNIVLHFEPRFTNLGSWYDGRLEYRAPELTLGGGVRAAFQPNGLTLGAVANLSYAPQEQPFRLSLEGLVGGGMAGLAYGANLGLDVDLPNALGTVNLYGAFEPWRLDVPSVRVGAGVDVAAGPGRAFVRAQGGASAPGLPLGWGVKVGYRLSLSPP